MAEESAWDRVQRLGVKAASNIDLLAIAMTREPGDLENGEATAQRLARRLGAGRLIDVSAGDLKDAAGLEAYEAARVLSAIELGRRLAGQGKVKTDEITSSEAAYAMFAHLADEPAENFCVGFLDAKAKLLSVETVHKGTLTMSVVGPREVFRAAVRENAAMIVLAHNHPSGDPTPSPEDVRVTHKLVEVGEALEITVVDHIVVGHDGRYVSLRQKGMM
ncbi:MAG: DNA repair protein RadC [Fimbriimonadaceae bacterium]|nr:DNA repair protein RadC [Fimbriimonadaceae bacterium]